MTSRERLLTAFRRGKADRVPVCPDLSVMVPARRTGRPFHELFLDGKEHVGWTSETYTRAYMDTVRYFGMDGWYVYGGLKEIRPPDAPEFVDTIETVYEGKLVKRLCRTPLGDLTEQEMFFADEPPWKDEKPIKDLREDFKRFKLWLGTGPWKYEKVFRDRDRIGELGVYSPVVPVFQDWWFNWRHGGFERCFMDFHEEERFMQEVHELYLEWALAYVRALVAAKPDEVMFGGSTASLSISSPDLFRRYELPLLRQAAAICHEGGVLAHLHVCGRSWELVQIVAEETDIDVMEPMEEPPGGNVDIAEAKRRIGNKLCIKGNINTFDFMLNATPDQVREKCRALIDAAAADGGFVLSTGDQCGRDTPHENIFAMVETAETYGRY